MSDHDSVRTNGVQLPRIPRGRPNSRTFIGLLLTQFLGAMNDNMFRWLAVKIAQPVIGADMALSLGLACFTLPYLLLAAPAGLLADRYSKRTVIVGCKLAEVGIMALGLLAILQGNMIFLLIVVGLMGSQSALFAPAKYGSIAEMLRPDRISAGNGWMGLITISASAIGTVGGYWLFGLSTTETGDTVAVTSLTVATLALLGVAVAGCGTSLLIDRLPAADPTRSGSWNPFADTAGQLRLLAGSTPLLRAALGIAFFWMLASLAQMNIDPFANEVLGLPREDVGLLLAVLVLGLGLGSVLAGFCSRGRVELGLVPLGATGIVISSFLVYQTGMHVDLSTPASSQHAYHLSSVWLFLLGMSAGFFNIPLEAYVQHRSDVSRRGSILAATNFVAFSFILVAAGAFYLMSHVLQMNASQVFLAAGLATLPVALYVFWLLPNATIRFMVWLASITVYRVRVYGAGNLPERGGALLVANHVSWLDGIFLILTSSRPIRMLAYADYIEGWWIRWLARMYGVIPIRPSAGPKALVQSLQTAREAIRRGELVCIFAEGQITRTGQLLPFQRGLLRIVDGTGAPVIPVFLDELWGSIFSYRGGRFFWKRPRRWPYPVSILFGRPLAQADDVNQVRQAVQNLGVEAVERRMHRELIPTRLFVRECRRSLTRTKVADSSGMALSGAKLLMATLIFRRILKRTVLDDDEKNVGVLLPPSVGGALANTSLAMMGRVPVNLNYTLSNEDLNYCIRAAGIRRVITSRRFLEKRPVEVDAELVLMEDLRPRATLMDKLAAAAQTWLLPAPLIERLHGLTNISPGELFTIIFTSGSTGEPKGVMLSYHNVGSNIEAVDQLFHIKPTDTILGVLPFFHSFGFAMTLWLVLTQRAAAVYHFNPVDARTIGNLCERHKVTIVMATPTFLRHYLKRCTKEQMANLDLAVVGAEKLPLDLGEAFEQKFGVYPTEGYGTTELSPLAAANVPAHRSNAPNQVSTKVGTVGRAIPGTTTKILHPETGEELGANQEGLLWIKGPNVMLGYLNQPEKTAEVVQDGWYNTGDIARIDDDGFIEITGRQSRFSKIGGEMVPHVRIEQELNKLVENHEDDEPELKLAVTSVTDERKGERLIVLHKPLPRPPEQLLRELAEQKFPNLWLPSADAFIEVDEIPLLGTGKLDLKGLKELALEKTQSAKSRT